jgi:hypothetical protein
MRLYSRNYRKDKDKSKKQPSFSAPELVSLDCPLFLPEASLSNTITQVPILWFVPPPNLNFIGRQELIQCLDNRLESPIVASTVGNTGETSIQALVGPGGFGKSQIAKHFAHKYRNRYQIVWWFNADSNMDEQFHFLARSLNEKFHSSINCDFLEPSQIIRKTLDILRQIADWLLIFDGVQDVIPMDDIPIQQTHSRGHVIITARNKNICTNPIQVPKYTHAEALDFLAAIIPSVASSEKEYMDNLAEELEEHPLALAQAAAYIQHTGASISRYLDLFTSQRSELWKREKVIVEERKESLHSLNTYHFTIESTIQMCLAKISNPLAHQILNVVCLLHYCNIPELALKNWISSFTTYNPDFDLYDTCSELLKHSILDTNHERHRTSYTVQKLVQEVIRDRLTEEEQVKYVRQLSGIISKLFDYDRDKKDTIASSSEYLHHAQKVLEHCKRLNNFSLDAGIILVKLGSYLVHVRFQPQEAKALLEVACGILENSTDPLTFQYYCKGLSYLSFCCYHLNLLQPAKDLADKVVFLYLHNNGNKEDEGLLSVYGTLGYIHLSFKDYPSSTRLCEKVLQIARETHNTEHPMAAAMYQLLAAIAIDQNNLNFAIQKLMECLEVKNKALGKEHPSTASCLHLLGKVLWRLKNTTAKQYTEKAYRIYVDALGADHTSTIDCQTELLAMYDDSTKTQGETT